MKLLKFDAEAQGWMRIDSAEEFAAMYPPPEYGRYRPQPHSRPERYPCYYMPVAFHYVSNGPDEDVLAYIYDFDEGSEQECLAFELKHN